jgi:hypothetical protein
MVRVFNMTAADLSLYQAIGDKTSLSKIDRSTLLSFRTIVTPRDLSR